MLFAGFFAVMASTPLQSIAVLMIGFACCFSVFSRCDVKLTLPAMILSTISLLYFSVRAFTSPVFDLGVSDLFLLLPAAGIYLVYLSGVVSRKQCFWGVVCVVVMLCLFNVSMFYPPINEWRDSLLPFARGDAESGLYNHRNFCSNLLMMSVLMSISIVLWVENLGWKRWVVCLVGFSGIVGLVFASARGGFIGVVVGTLFILGCYFILNKMGSRKRLLMTVSSFVLSISVLVAGWMLFEKRGVTIDESVEVGGRKKYFAMAIDQVPDAPVLGSGSMSHSYLSYKYWSLHTNKGDHVWVHNEFLQTLTDYGLVGFLVLLLFLFYCVWAFIGGLKGQVVGQVELPPAFKLKLIGMAVMIGFLVNSFVSFPAHAQPNFLIFAFACAVVVLEGETKEIKSAFLTKLNTVIMKFSLLVVGVSSIFFGYKELQALRIFSKHDIYVDNAFWSPDEHLHDGWYTALTEVVEVSPSYKRYERLAGLTLEKAKLEEDAKVQKQLYQRALELSNLSLSRHPYYAVALSNKLSSLQGLEMYEEAMPYHDEFIELTKYRQIFFEPLNKKLTSLLQWARKLSLEGDLQQASLRYRQAYETLYEPLVHKRDIPQNMSSLIIVDRGNLLMHIDADEELDEFWEDFYNQRFPAYLNALEQSDLIYAHAKLIYRYAEKKFLSRKPELAFKWYKVAYRCYNKLDHSFMTIEIMDEKDKLSKQIQFLKAADITPAK